LLDAKLKELREFAVCIYERLLSLPNAERDYETLWVGVRLDIGVGRDGLFFVNEVTRWPQADFFPESSAPPHLRLCEAYGEALAKYLQ
jgi:hypothetical protein